MSGNKLYVWTRTSRYSRIYHRWRDGEPACCYGKGVKIIGADPEPPEGWRECLLCFPLGVPRTGSLEEWTRARKLYASGYSIDKTAEYLGRRASVVRSWLKAQGVRMRDRHVNQRGSCRYPHKEVELAKFLYDRLKLTQREISYVTGWPRSCVARRLSYTDVEMRSGAESVRLQQTRKDVDLDGLREWYRNRGAVTSSA